MAVQEFRAALAQHLSDSSDAASGLIRRHDRNLSEADFICPSHSKAELWRRRSRDGAKSDFAALKRLCESDVDSDNNGVTEANEVMCSLLKISSVRLNKKQEVMLLRLDRPSALTAVICGILERGVFWHRKERSGVAGRFENCEISSRMGKTSELSALRCSMVAGCLDRLSGDLHQDEVNEKKARIRVGCADKNYLENNNEERTGYVQVGVVKSGRLGLASVYERLFDKYLSVARERETEMGEAQRLSNVNSTVAADLAFRLLGTSIGEPCCAEGSETCGEASFALYNYTRLVHILKAHQEDDGYPELGGVRSADFSLLKEDLEWEAAFNFLLPYQELLSEVGARLGSLHRICHFISGLTNVFSRYYNRHRVLKDPSGAPHVLPAVEARVRLLMAVRAVYDHAFGLLGIEPVSNM